jgi:hypothetical protein
MTDADRTTSTQPSSRRGNLARAFRETRKSDPRMLPLVLGVGLGLLALFVLLGLFIGGLVVMIPLGILVGVLGALTVFSRRAQAAVMKTLTGKAGAAAALLGSFRGGWRVTPAIAFNRRQDFVHLAVGRPGVLLVAEGAPAGATALLKQERRRVARVAGDVPIHEVVVGEGHGQVPLPRLQAYVLRLPRRLAKNEVAQLDNRLKALGTANVPLPKGPMPRGRPR